MNLRGGALELRPAEIFAEALGLGPEAWRCFRDVAADRELYPQVIEDE